MALCRSVWHTEHLDDEVVTLQKPQALWQRISLALRSDTEFQGAAVRLMVGVMVSTLLLIGMWSGQFTLSGHIYGSFALYFFVLSFAFATHILWRPGRVWRPYLSILFDITTTTIAVILTGPVHSLFFPLYLWIIVTNGTRFGSGAMVVAAAMAITMYNTQLIVQGLWLTNLLNAAVYGLFLIIFPLYFIHMIRDLHHARRAAENANQAKSEFLANMTHELRTPLVGVTALSSLLSTTHLDSEQRGYVSTLQSSARLLGQLIDDLLDFSRIEAGKLKLRNEPFEPRRTIMEVVEMMNQLADEKGIALRHELNPELGAVIGDSVRFKQILVNLMGNAVKFTSTGEVVIRAELLSHDHGLQRMRIEVEDTGIGMSAEQLARVFERFQQGDTSAARVYQGTGLGTTIAKYLVEMMGGEINVASEMGKGTRFWFEVTLPAAQSVSTTPAPVVSTIPQGSEAGPILLVEDNAINSMAIATILRKAGYRVDIAEDGPQALVAQASNRYPLVFLDMQLPGMDGPTVARCWREHESGEHTTIIALTANASTKDRDICLAAGMDDFLSKPVETTQLLALAALYCNHQTRNSTARN